jgi:hypothetical protein
MTFSSLTESIGILIRNIREYYARLKGQTPELVLLTARNIRGYLYTKIRFSTPTCGTESALKALASKVNILYMISRASDVILLARDYGQIYFLLINNYSSRNSYYLGVEQVCDLSDGVEVPRTRSRIHS